MAPAKRPIRHAVTNAIRLIETDDRLFVIGADTSGRMLEVVARPTETAGLIVFHAMPLRPAMPRGTCHD